MESLTSATPQAAADSASQGVTGRWMLASPNAPPCGVNFTGSAREGRLSPDGGCPARFYMARTWRYDGAVLTVLDPDGEPLATLNYANGRFDGPSAAGAPLTMTRPQMSAEQQ